MPNEHIEYFKRFAKTYLMWSHSHMDMIVRDVMLKDADNEAKRKEDIKKQEYENSLMGRLMKATTDRYSNQYAEQLIKDNAFISGTTWNVVKTGSGTLTIKLPPS